MNGREVECTQLSGLLIHTHIADALTPTLSGQSFMWYSNSGELTTWRALNGQVLKSLLL